MTKKALPSIPQNLAPYIDLAENESLLKAFENSIQGLEDVNVAALKEKEYFRYAPGKWNAHDILQHLSDTERIFAYRALRFSRGDKTTLQGYDQDSYAQQSNAQHRSIDSLFEEFLEVHKNSLQLFSTFSDEMLLRSGFYSGMEVSVLAIGYTILGHQLHHFHILRDRYQINF